MNININAPSATLIPQLRKLWKEAFGDGDEFLDVFFATAFAPKRCRAATISGKLAAAIYWFDCNLNGQKIAYIYAVATAREYRGQGICKNLMNNTHIHLKKLGYKCAILVPGSKELFSFYEGMGYKICSSINEFSCTAESAGTDITKIEKSEYALMRRAFVPIGGVIQENENLDFLEHQAEFFKGEDFLLAARFDEKNLFGIELLGNTEKAPKIVNALKCQKGIFRTNGNLKPFAMCYTLFEDAQSPAYFGLAFD